MVEDKLITTRFVAFTLLLYHPLSTSTLPFWTIYFGVPSPILDGGDATQSHPR